MPKPTSAGETIHKRANQTGPTVISHGTDRKVETELDDIKGKLWEEIKLTWHKNDIAVQKYVYAKRVLIQRFIEPDKGRRRRGQGSEGASQRPAQ